MKKLTYMLILLIIVLSGCSSTDIVDPNDQLEKDGEAIDAYLKDVIGLTESEYVKHYSGLRYRILEEGTGTKPEIYHYVRVKYKGMLMDEEMTVFEESPTTDPPYSTFQLSSTIPGWQVGLRLLPEGSKAVLYIPSSMAYGKPGTVTIPPNSNLIFEVELLDVIE